MREMIKKLWRRRQALLVLVLAVALLCMGMGAASAEDFDTKCTLQLTSGNADDLMDYVVFDVYEIAKATPKDGVDDYEFTDWFGGLKAVYDDIAANSTDESDTKWEPLAQQAADAILKGDGDTSGIRKYTGLKFKADPVELDGGLYLILARAATPPETLPEGTVSYSVAETETGLISFVDVDSHHYTFSPIILQSMPYRESTTDDWQQNFVVEVKNSDVVETKTVIIKKNLTTYNTEAPATFTFRVNGTNPKHPDTVEFSGVYETPEMTAAGEANVIEIRNVPIGTVLSIEELESAKYEFVSVEGLDTVVDKGGSVTITEDSAPEIVVTFTNRSKPSVVEEGSVENKFTYQDGAWVWTADPKSETVVTEYTVHGEHIDAYQEIETKTTTYRVN